MYGKIFAKMYEGTLYGQWEALVTFQQMIVLCDADGMIDMTPQAIASRTSIPLHIIEKGIKILEAPDPYSRTPDQEGRRIELIDAHRPWGWHLVNHAKYTALQDADTVRAQTRERVRKHRAAKAGVTVTDGNGQKRHTDIDTNTDKDIKSKSTVRLKPDAVQVLQFLNEKTGRNFEPVDETLKPIMARLRSGSTVEDLRAVIAKKCREWAGDEKMAQYLRPKTLFNATNFANYKGELASAESLP